MRTTIATVVAAQDSTSEPGRKSDKPNPLKNCCFGEQHLHTQNSPDAALVDIRRRGAGDRAARTDSRDTAGACLVVSDLVYSGSVTSQENELVSGVAAVPAVLTVVNLF